MSIPHFSRALLATLLWGCGSGPATDAGIPDGGTADATLGDVGALDAAGDAGAIDGGAADAGSATLRSCPRSGTGALLGDHCFVVTPIETGLSADGAGADRDQYALRPTGAARGELMIFLNGSGGWPAVGIATPERSWYSVAREEGLHALGVSYRSDEAVGRLCRDAGAVDDGCFLPTRETILDGAFRTGAAPELMDITADEGVYTRMHAALVHLAAHDPDGGWDAFFDASIADPAASIRWSLVLASGHSQGGGHAALLGRRHALARVLFLASPCDGSGTEPATWLTEPALYATDPATRFFGLGSDGDALCTSFEEAWAALGMPSDHQNDGALGCDAERSPHSRSIVCAENAALWARMLE